MKRGKRIVLILLACMAVAAAVAVLRPREREPEYNGRKLSKWLAVYRQPIGARAPVVSEEAADAVRHIGTNGVPFLVKWIQEHKVLPPWRERLFEVAYRWNLYSPTRRKVLELVGGRELRSGRALLGFIILGPDARAAIPDLVRMANGENKDTAQSAITALGYLGKEALPPLLELANKNGFQFHDDAIVAIGQMRYIGTNAHPAVVFLVQCLQNRQDEVGAADILGRLGLESDISVPALAGCLQSTNSTVRMWGAISLGRFGANAQAAVPGLLKALNDPDVDVRTRATNALRLIAPEVLGK